MAALAIDALLDGLNPEQRAAVVHEGSPLLIVAGAGSGKTRVLTHRIAYLLAARDVAPHEILAITFTNKAAGEMAARVAALVGPQARSMWVMTFHSACVRILRREAKRFGYPSSFSIYDQADSQRLMALTCRELELDAKQYPPKAMAAQVSNLKNELIDYETFASRAQTAREKALAEAYAEYQRRLVAAGAMDFDDLIMVTVNLFQALPEVAEQYRRRFRQVLVDEYQDTNHAQYILIRELVSGGAPLFSSRTAGADRPGDPIPPAELCVVGDADQSIYAFRGATIRNIEEFEQDYPDAKVILLEQNYRSTQNILAAANAVVSQNRGRKPKNLWSDQGAGPPIIGYVADNEHDEAAFVAEEVDRLTDAGQATPGQVAVFYRTNAQSRVFEEVFIRVGLPYRVVGGVRFYERREVRDLLAYLRLIANPADEVSLRRVLNVPKRGIGDRAEDYVAAFAQREHSTFAEALARPADVPGLAARSARAIEGFNTLITGLRELSQTVPVADLTEAVLDRTGYIEALEESSDLQDASRVENLEELVSVAREYDGIHWEGVGRDAGRLPRAGVPGRRRRPDPRRGGARRPGHDDDPAHRQGPGVPRGVPHRDGRRGVPAPALADQREGTGGGAPAGLRRDHPGRAAPLPDPGAGEELVGPPLLPQAVEVPHRDPGRPDRVAPGRVRRPVVGHARPGADGAAGGDPVTGEPPGARAVTGGHGDPRQVRPGYGGIDGRLRRPGRGEDRFRCRVRRQAPGAPLRPSGEVVGTGSRPRPRLSPSRAPATARVRVVPGVPRLPVRP